MLRVTQLLTDGIPTLRLEGKLVGPWVDEVRAASEEALEALGDADGSTLRLDLAGVSFIDAAGAELLEHLLRRGAALAAASNYVAELLHASIPAAPAKEGARQ